jgi:ubiquinone/menaquinone biosynthesis C-methylase UbiE
MSEEKVAGNVYNKYQTKNPIARQIMGNFLRKFNVLISPLDVPTILEVGCGEGYLLSHVQDIKPASHLYGSDFSSEIIDFAKSNIPEAELRVADVCMLPYESDSFDLVVACAILEHVPDYHKALEEIKRVGKTRFIFSVPHEPIWRILNVLRLRYLNDLGNTPGHVNHWGRKEFISLISEHFHIERAAHPFPWSMLLCTKK